MFGRFLVFSPGNRAFAQMGQALFIDDDQAYLFYGGPGQPHGVKLEENMMEIDSELHFLEGLDDFKEGLWVFKRNDIYYAIYPDTTKPANEMRYAMSKTPLGPYTHEGVFLEGSDVITTHGSIVEYNGHRYIFIITARFPVAKRATVPSASTRFPLMQMVQSIRLNRPSTKSTGKMNLYPVGIEPQNRQHTWFDVGFIASCAGGLAYGLC